MIFLNRLFSIFDRLTDKYKVHKVFDPIVFYSNLPSSIDHPLHPHHPQQQMLVHL